MSAKTVAPNNHQTILSRLVRRSILQIEDIEKPSLVVYHDDQCAYLRGQRGRCHCKPRIELEGQVIYGD